MSSLPTTRAAAAEPRSRLIEWALAQVGTCERAPGGRLAERDRGRIDAWQREFGLSGVAWCGCFVGYGLRVVAGIAEIDDRVVWVPFIVDDARTGLRGWAALVPAGDAVAGDVAVFSWKATGEPEHVGFVIANERARGVMRTLEGNTTRGDDGDQSSGGGVFERERAYEHIVACARPRYPGEPAERDSLPTIPAP